MKKTLVISLCLLLVASFALARNADKGTADLKIMNETVVNDNTAWQSLGKNLPRASAQVETFFLASYEFDSGPNCVTEGFVSHDLGAQTGDYIHVDNFAGLGGGGTGLLVALEGNQSMWCGARPNAADLNLCGYAQLPGYGNNWDQALCSPCVVTVGGASIGFSIFWDSEPGYDATALEIDAGCLGSWAEVYGGLGVWDGTGTDTLSVAIADTLHAGSFALRFHFTADGAWSDQDGLWGTDGAFVVDEITVDDTGGNLVAYENFEDELVGDNDATDWVTCTPESYGDFAALYPGLTLVQEDPCNSNLDCVWTFYNGSTVDYSCGGWPGQTSVPYENVRGQYIANSVWSPDIPVTGMGDVWEINFITYRDLPLRALIFYIWSVRGVVGGCPTGWDDYNFVYYGGGKDWLRRPFGIGQFVPGGSTDVNVYVGVQDMCGFWNGIYGDCSCHSHAPLIDEVEVYRIASYGPQWQVRDLDLFQDTFGPNARADAANDILPSASASIGPGDSVSITVADPNGMGFHVLGDPASGPGVYGYFSIDGPHAGVVDGNLVDDARYNLVGTTVANGRTWAIIQMDTSVTAAGSVVADDYNIDLNDNYFSAGDIVWYFFGAKNASGMFTWYSQAAPGSGQSDDIELIASYADEFTVLPVNGNAVTGDILYVDGMNFRGAQPFFDTAFDCLGLLETVDRYDIRGPSSAVGNHPGSRVGGIALTSWYRKIIYDVGDLQVAFGDGSGNPDKSDDTAMLFDFLQNLPQQGGVYLCGDDVADEWLNTFSSASATGLRGTFMNFTVTDGDHTNYVDVSPYGVGVAGGIFKDALNVPDKLIVYGGCPLINDFDVLGASGASVVQMEYVDTRNPLAKAPAILSQATVNTQPATVGFILSGFSFGYIRDDVASGVLDRCVHMERILTWLGSIVDPPVGTGTPNVAKNNLEQNVPNPFNPTTTINYEIKESGLVSLRVYNVAGQLVKTLVDGQRNAGQVYEATWNGLNDAGQPVSSGVYFYKLVAKNFTQTKKMVLLK